MLIAVAVACLCVHRRFAVPAVLDQRSSELWYYRTLKLMHDVAPRFDSQRAVKENACFSAGLSAVLPVGFACCTRARVIGGGRRPAARGGGDRARVHPGGGLRRRLLRRGAVFLPHVGVLMRRSTVYARCM